jgi:hypothetical protein
MHLLVMYVAAASSGSETASAGAVKYTVRSVQAALRLSAVS